MNLFLFLLFSCTALINYHYYRNGLFNSHRGNLPPIYAAGKGPLIVWTWKTILFVSDIYFASSALLVLHFFLIQVVVKFLALKSVLNEGKEYFYIHLGRELVKKETATKQDIDTQLSEVEKKKIQDEASGITRNAIFGFSGIFQGHHSMLFNFLFGKRKSWH